MAVKTFSFAHNGVEDKYPENSTKVQFGGGYEFASRPKGPPQIQFRLSMVGMLWVLDEAGLVTNTGHLKYNAKRLMDFYEEHQLYEKFEFPHPVRGTVLCRFREPITIPPPILGGSGLISSFDITLLGQP